MFTSSSLSSLSSFPLAQEFSPRHIAIMRTIDALWALNSVEGGKASAAYIASLSSLDRRKMRNALKEQINNCNRHDYRQSLVTLCISFEELSNEPLHYGSF